METSPVEITDPSQVPAHQDRNFQSLIAAIEHSKIEVADLSAAALRGVLKGVITGEGPTTTGRAHFSRTLDPGDALLCARRIPCVPRDARRPHSRTVRLCRCRPPPPRCYDPPPRTQALPPWGSCA